MKIDIDCEQSLSFPCVFLAFLRASIELSSSELHSLLVSFPNLLNFYPSSARGGFQEQKPTTRSLK